MIISPAGIDLIRHFEQCRLTAYLDSGGTPTIGWGHTATVAMGQTITQVRADALLVGDLGVASAGVTAALGGKATTQNCFDAFTSLAYNEGVSAFADSTMLKRYLSNQDCSAEFLRWVLEKGKVEPGLVIRRMAERLMFLNRSWQQIV